jgi:hypothetical protein
MTKQQPSNETSSRRGSRATVGSANHKHASLTALQGPRAWKKAGGESGPEKAPVDRQHLTLSTPDSKMLTSSVTDGMLTIQNKGPARIRVVAGTDVIGVFNDSIVASGNVMTVQFLGFVAVETIGKEPATFDFEVIESK